MIKLRNIELQEITLKSYKEFNLENFKEEMKFIDEVLGWGTMNYASYKNKFLTFTVDATNFNGRVWIGLHGNDLFDAFFTNEDGTHIHRINDMRKSDVIQEINLFLEGTYTA